MVYSSTLFDFKEVEVEKLPSTTNWPLTKEPASKIHPDPPFDFALCFVAGSQKELPRVKLIRVDSRLSSCQTSDKIWEKCWTKEFWHNKVSSTFFCSFFVLPRKTSYLFLERYNIPPFHSEYCSTSPSHHVLLSTFVVHPTYPPRPSNHFF